jgi:biotin transport system permease protein
MLSLYLGQVTWLHRMPAGWKLLALALASVLLLPVTHLWVLAGSTLLATLGHISLGSLGRRRLLTLCRTLLPMLVFLAIAQWLSFVLTLGFEQGNRQGLEQALTTFFRILVMVTLADLITLSSTSQELIHALRFLFTPLRGLGVSSEKLSLAMALVFRWVSLLKIEWESIRASFKARGCKNPKLRSTTPLLRRAQRMTVTMTDALRAREPKSDL